MPQIENGQDGKQRNEEQQHYLAVELLLQLNWECERIRLRSRKRRSSSKERTLFPQFFCVLSCCCWCCFSGCWWLREGSSIMGSWYRATNMVRYKLSGASTHQADTISSVLYVNKMVTNNPTNHPSTRGRRIEGGCPLSSPWLFWIYLGNIHDNLEIILMVSYCLAGILSLIWSQILGVDLGSPLGEKTIKIKRNGNWIFICWIHQRYSRAEQKHKSIRYISRISNVFC